MSFCSKAFNPTLVRLRPATDSHLPGEAFPFQSHAGSIEAVVSKHVAFCSATFQSHAGSIEAPDARTPARSATPLSIPRWFD